MPFFYLLATKKVFFCRLDVDDTFDSSLIGNVFDIVEAIKNPLKAKQSELEDDVELAKTTNVYQSYVDILHAQGIRMALKVESMCGQIMVMLKGALDPTIRTLNYYILSHQDVTKVIEQLNQRYKKSDPKRGVCVTPETAYDG